MKPIRLSIGNLSLEHTDKGSFHILHPCVEPSLGCYTVALIHPREEGCDLETVGLRPWGMDGTSVSEFMNFAWEAMRIIDQNRSDVLSK